MIESRLKEYSSTHPRLNEGELLIAFLAPISRRVHMLSMVIREDGQFELAERLTSLPGRNNIFHKEHGNIGAPQLAELRDAVVQLAATNAEIHGPLAEELDSDEWETNDRRSLAFWHDGERDGCAVRAAEFYQRFGIAPPMVDTYREHLDAVWRLILPLVERPWFEPASSVDDERWSFPLQTLD